MLRLLPPAGTKLTLGQALATCARMLTSSETVPEFSGDTAERLGAAHVLSAGSGRAALYAILKALHSLRPERNIVAVPAYTCFSVPAAIIRAGLRIQPVDVDPRTLDFDFASLSALSDTRLLAIIGTELFGFIGDIKRLKAVATANEAFLVDDAAQAFGSTANGSRAGLLGDVGFYSIGRGKPLFGMDGGVIVTNSEEISEATSAILQGFGAPSPAQPLADSVRLAGYFAMFRPLLYRIADSLPFLNLGATIFDPDFPLHKLAPGAGSALNDSLALTKQANATRLAIAAEIKRSAATGSRFYFPEPAASCSPAYPRLPVVAETKVLRDRAVAEMRAAGIGASPFYPTAICDIPDISAHMAGESFHCNKAERLADTLFTLPTHSLVTGKDIASISDVLRRLEN